MVTSARTWLHPRFFTSRDLVDRVHWQLQAGGALRYRTTPGRCGLRERLRFLPEAVEAAADHADGLGAEGPTSRRPAGWRGSRR